ncbi:protein FAM200A-like [Octopus bimaculoides]|uniref:protein FAM200A-like n=1 Tax=Octopus bimaculoides TaxID=37653 RepID=UPI00071CB1F4|nr:protein FAM200A-like [Octopus bimaculoides]|eukprot:XP_014781910.1 PREDICTED: protein FAM200A-like [Octopus bimaculoides]
METVVKIVSFIVSRSSLTHRQLKSFLQELDSEYADLPLHSNVCWVNRGNVLNKFVSCLEEIKIFFEEKHFPELNNEDWLFKLMFLSKLMFISKHLNDLNLHLQGRDQTVLDLFEHLKGFLFILDIFWRDIHSNTYKYFPNVKAYSNRFNVNKNELQKYIATLKEEFSKRGKNFEIYAPIHFFLIKPNLTDLKTNPFLSLFEWMHVDSLEMEMIELTTSELW